MTTRRDTSAESAARFLALPRSGSERRPESRPPPIVLWQIRVGGEYRYRDEATGRLYTAVEARQIKGPIRTFYCPPLSEREAPR